MLLWSGQPLQHLMYKKSDLSSCTCWMLWGTFLLTAPSKLVLMLHTCRAFPSSTHPLLLSESWCSGGKRWPVGQWHRISIHYRQFDLATLLCQWGTSLIGVVHCKSCWRCVFWKILTVNLWGLKWSDTRKCSKTPHGFCWRTSRQHMEPIFPRKQMRTLPR